MLDSILLAMNICFLMIIYHQHRVNTKLLEITSTHQRHLGIHDDALKRLNQIMLS